MNPSQDRLLRYAMMGLGVTLLFPPFVEYLPNNGMNGVGFGFLLAWPKHNFTAVIHAPTLLVEWLFLAILTSIQWFRLQEQRPTPVQQTTAASNSDTQIESAYILANATIRAAEIVSDRNSQRR